MMVCLMKYMNIPISMAQPKTRIPKYIKSFVSSSADCWPGLFLINSTISSSASRINWGCRILKILLRVMNNIPSRSLSLYLRINELRVRRCFTAGFAGGKVKKDNRAGFYLFFHGSLPPAQQSKLPYLCSISIIFPLSKADVEENYFGRIHSQ